MWIHYETGSVKYLLYSSDQKEIFTICTDREIREKVDFCDEEVFFFFKEIFAKRSFTQS